MWNVELSKGRSYLVPKCPIVVLFAFSILQRKELMSRDMYLLYSLI